MNEAIIREEKRIVGNMPTEDKEAIIRTFPTALLIHELSLRCEDMENKISDISSILGGGL